MSTTALRPQPVPPTQGCTLPGLRLSAATWRALLGQPQQAERDLAEADPQLYRGLQYLRQLAADRTVTSAAAVAAAKEEEEDGVAAMGLHFAVHDAFGREVRKHGGVFEARRFCSAIASEAAARASVSLSASCPVRGTRFALQPTSNVPLNLPTQPHLQVELCPGGGHQLVTAANLEDYIALLAQYKQVPPSECLCCGLALALLHHQHIQPTNYNRKHSCWL